MNQPIEHEGELLETLLRDPGAIVEDLDDDRRSSAYVRTLAVCSVTCLLLFGIVVGTFSLGDQLWAAPLKIVCGVAFTALICLPSLYIFSCLSGVRARLSRVLGVLAALVCLTSLLLVGFAPILLVFTRSTDSVHFVGALAVIFWCVSLGFGAVFLREMVERWGKGSSVPLHVWIFMFAMVSFQMTTTLRPILGESDVLLTAEKKFFLIHWADL